MKLNLLIKVFLSHMRKITRFGIKYPLITYYESMITEQFIISSIKSKDKYFILYDKSIVFVKQIKKHSSGEVMLEVCKFKRFFQMSNNPICSTIVGCFYVPNY